MLPNNLVGALRTTAHAVWAGMQRDHQALRVMLRDLDDFRISSRTSGAKSAPTSTTSSPAGYAPKPSAAPVHVVDPDATAAVLLASLTYYPILQP